MTDRIHWRDLLWRHAAWLVAGALLATSMLVATSFRAAPGPAGPGPSAAAGSSSGPVETTVPYAGPDLIGIFTACNPACDLEVATEGIGRRLTMTDREVDESAPSLAPDLRRVVFRCGSPAVEPGGEDTPRPAGLGSLCLAEIPEDPEEVATVTTLLESPGVDYGAPAWSPDGTAIAFQFRREAGEAGEVGIGVWHLDTGRPTSATPELPEAASPAWSADGSMLAFSCGGGTEGKGSTRFCVMPSEGGEVTALGEVEGACGVPAFMPDGVHLGVVCVPPGADGGDLFMLALDEPFAHRFTSSQRIAPEGIRRVVFDPDQHHAFVRRDDALWALGIPGGEWSLPPLPPVHGDFDLRVLE